MDYILEDINTKDIKLPVKTKYLNNDDEIQEKSIDSSDNDDLSELLDNL
jgi:hypothetical protein